ncbi:putative L-ascorbate peroxidase 6 isoform X2 [Rhododendron vialii]|uniref:putative L-ascorbate peroxidase 6 isoform X2 n=1 Tax=Rhododendron vialii TaxID=182163 RepID=UPI00265FFBCC|nr:putative L-ascorbate peroxidase 6 isoform X2 [Rhododendron vialii]
MMTATGVSSAASLSSAATNRRISKIRAKFRPTHPCGSKTIEALSSVATAAVENESASFGRRGMLSVTTIPFFLNLHESLAGFHADAAEPFRDYFLVKEEVKKVLSKGKAAGVLRLVFHDAGTFEIEDNAGGMNGSIVYELDRPENTGLQKSLKILGKAKAEVDMMIQPVSWADMIAVAGAEAVSVCGGPNIPLQLGRIDSMVPDPEGKLPQESLDASGLKRCFQRKGFSTQELVALSGAHTLGSKGFGNPISFDNAYFKILLEKPWSSSAGMSSMIGLPTDRALVEDGECFRWISMYANNQDLFFEDFKNVYIKLVNTGAMWKPSL